MLHHAVGGDRTTTHRPGTTEDRGSAGGVHPAAVCVVGVGPRGLSVLERLCANVRHLAPDTPLTVHVVDPYPPGPGRVWRTEQSPYLLMNTVASQVTMFTDDSVEMDGPVVPGPSLYEWARAVAATGAASGHPEAVLAEARRTGPNTYPSRAFYGHYLTWAFQRVCETAPPLVQVRVHRSEAVSYDATGTDGRARITLADRTVLSADVVVLAQGHVPGDLTAEEQALSTFAELHALRYIPPQNPGDADLSGIRPGEPVFLRGLGLCFFDYLSLLTEGRGGRFVPADGRLRYLPSGEEPQLYAGSRRGVPHHARGENQKGAYGRHEPLVLTPQVIADLRLRPGLDFRQDVWPLIAKELETVYYATLIHTNANEAEVRRFRDAYLKLPLGDPAEQELLDEFGVDGASRWDWNRVLRPYGDRVFADADGWRNWLLVHLHRDLREAALGNVDSALKAALDVLRDLRNEIRMVVDHGGLSGASYRDDLQRWYSPLNAFLSIGPPASRVAEMVALIEAGVLALVGPQPRIERDPTGQGFHVSSTVVSAAPVTVTTVIEARLQEPSLHRTADPLLRHLLATGQATRYRIPDPAGDYETDGLAVTPRPYHLIDATGRPHPRCLAFGVPTEAVHWVTAVGIRPGVNSVTVADADSIARTVLRLVATAAPVPTELDRTEWKEPVA